MCQITGVNKTRWSKPPYDELIGDSLEVIKVEDVKGDPFRKIMHAAQRTRKSKGIPCTIFEAVNRGQKSVMISRSRVPVEQKIGFGGQYLINMK